MKKLDEDKIDVIARKHHTKFKFMFLFPSLMSITFLVLFLSFAITPILVYKDNVKIHNEVMERYSYLMEDPVYAALYGDDAPEFPTAEVLGWGLATGIPLLLCLIYLLLSIRHYKVTPEITIASDEFGNYYIWHKHKHSYIYVKDEDVVDVKNNYSSKKHTYLHKPFFNINYYEKREVVYSNYDKSFTTIFYKKDNRVLRVKVEVSEPLYIL